MDKPAAMEAQIVNARNVGVHKSVALTLHIPEERAAAFFEMFGWPQSRADQRQERMTARHEEIAERIIKYEGMLFALAVKVGKDGDLREAREHLKAAIVRALADAAQTSAK